MTSHYNDNITKLMQICYLLVSSNDPNLPFHHIPEGALLDWASSSSERFIKKIGLTFVVVYIYKNNKCSGL